MKKTLIALALATTAVSGSAMAWVPNGLGGTMEFGGTLTPKDVVNPWEVKIGPNMNTLNGSLKPNEKVVKITLANAIPVLGIRTTASSISFNGAPGISPQINYSGLIDPTKFDAGKVPVTLDVKSADAAATKIGTLTTKLTAGGMGMATGDGYYNTIVALEANSLFRGGVAQDRAKALPGLQVTPVSRSFFSDITNNFDEGGVQIHTGTNGSNYVPTDPLKKYSAYYASGFQSGESVTITLDSPATANMNWKVSFPVTVSYQ
ncbi:hypothetical protein KCK33_004504 [Salmonella enterica]|nr:hypothetical protein [Salmonella enterica]EGA0602504.1 hypothetical protein [Salmonella enterica]EHD2148102.1 hypothetical protein [Salmonella enterica]EHK2354324.1 hypothetical protein [Salmonella enterica]